MFNANLTQQNKTGVFYRLCVNIISFDFKNYHQAMEFNRFFFLFLHCLIISLKSVFFFFRNETVQYNINKTIILELVHIFSKNNYESFLF